MNNILLFTKLLGVQLKIPKSASVECHIVCTLRVQYELVDINTHLADYNWDGAHCEFLSSSLTLKMSAHSILCTKWRNYSEKFNKLFKKN